MAEPGEDGGITPGQGRWLPGSGRQGMLLHQPARGFLGQEGQLGRTPSLGVGRKAQRAAPGHRRSYKLLGRGYKRANPCSHRTGFVPSPEPSLTINRGWVSSKLCSVCCLLSENRSAFRMREERRECRDVCKHCNDRVKRVNVIKKKKKKKKTPRNKGDKEGVGFFYISWPENCGRTP